MFFIIRDFIFWLIWVLFADKKRWRELFVVAIFAALLGTLTDHLMHHYKLWHYSTEENIGKVLVEAIDDFGIYTVTAYLFIQMLPNQHTFWNMLRYLFIWSSITITIEWVHVVTGHMRHLKWWTYLYSFIADWFLFWIFYKFHQVFELKKLSQ